MWVCRLLVTSARSINTFRSKKIRSNFTNGYPFKCNWAKHWVHSSFHCSPCLALRNVPGCTERLGWPATCIWSPMWKRICTFRWRLWSDTASHTLHWDCRSLVWLKTCLWIFSHFEHWLTQFTAKQSFTCRNAHASLSIIFYFYLFISAIHVKKNK